MTVWIKPVMATLLFLYACAAPCALAQVVPLDLPTIPVEAAAISPGTSLAARDQPIAILQGWSLHDESRTTPVARGSEPALDPGNPEFIVFFNATGGDPAKTEFRYRLDGYDAEWTVTTARLAHYRRLPPGRYRFEVQARSVGEPWASKEVMLPMVQRPFFYQTWYAFVLVGVVVFALGAQLLGQRERLLKGRMGMLLEERNRIASDCHDTLMAGFAAISWQLEATAKLLDHTGIRAEAATQSCELARSMVAHCQVEARRIIWDLRDTEEITNSLSRALTEATSAYREREAPRMTFDVQGSEVPISPAAVHHLVCIGQEAVTNAVRHAEPSSIRMQLCYESDSLRLSVRDDGRGFQMSDRAAYAGHFGIPVMEERARKLGGALHLTSSATSGTEVAVTVSFQRILQAGTQQHYIVPWIGG